MERVEFVWPEKVRDVADFRSEHRLAKTSITRIRQGKLMGRSSVVGLIPARWTEATRSYVETCLECIAIDVVIYSIPTLSFLCLAEAAVRGVYRAQ